MELREAFDQERGVVASETEGVRQRDPVLDAPSRAEDSAVVPISIRTRFPQSAERHVDKLYLIIDNNPSPVSAICGWG